MSEGWKSVQFQRHCSVAAHYTIILADRSLRSTLLVAGTRRKQGTNKQTIPNHRNTAVTGVWSAWDCDDPLCVSDQADSGPSWQQGPHVALIDQMWSFSGRFCWSWSRLMFGCCVGDNRACIMSFYAVSSLFIHVLKSVFSHSRIFKGYAPVDHFKQFRNCMNRKIVGWLWDLVFHCKCSLGILEGSCTPS